jgi:RNA polymerase sigma factor (sigma-70 family)
MKKKQYGREHLKAILDGDNEIALLLYQELMAFLMKYKENYGVNTELIEDIAQNSFAIFLDNARKDKIRFDASLNTYIKSIGRFLIINYFKEKKRELPVEKEFIENMKLYESVDGLEEMEIKWMVFYKEFQNLKEDCRKIILLSLSDYKYSEISEEMNYSSRDFVKLKMKRCKEYLKNLIKNNTNYRKYLNYEREDFKVFGWKDE